MSEGGNGTSISNAISFFSDEYLEAGWRRASIVAKAVQWGFNVLVTDVDIVWFKSPYSYISRLDEVTQAKPRAYKLIE